MEVRRELLSAAIAVLLVGQDLKQTWNPTVWMFDASDMGGGVCSTKASWEEVTAEGRWGVRGGWTKYVNDPNFFDHYRPGEETPELDWIHLFPKDVGQVKGVNFLHMFSGMKRPKDLEWFLVRDGARRGYKVNVIGLD